MITADELMTQFASHSAAPERRYLWTDAFAVCNFVGLGRTDRAVALVDRVHHVLGHHRSDEPTRRGWLSGLSEADGAAHPTRAGLRIGKPHPERAAGEAPDEAAEWERDGQYFHYLAKWLVALDRVARATGDATYLRWARELAIVAHAHFVHGPAGDRRMYWKLSIDLTRPLVPSMGPHDPLDGYLTCLELDATAHAMRATKVHDLGPGLAAAAADYRTMVEPQLLATRDPLGIGELLVGAHRLAQLGVEPDLRDALLVAAGAGYRRYTSGPELRATADLRLAFRELGLAIGLATVPHEPGSAANFPRHAEVRAALARFWSDPSHRRFGTYRAHADIDDVMLATALSPGGYLEPEPLEIRAARSLQRR